MYLSFSKELEEYRMEARSWLEEVIPDWWHDYSKRKSDRARYEKMMSDWDKLLYQGGYSGISWPKEYGGQGETILKEMIFEQESGRIDAPKGRSYLGKILLGPTLLKYGTEEQKKKFIPRIVSSEDIWCQGFSEPNAGSDLAALTTRAEMKDDHWSIEGQKVWTSEAQHANWCFMLARTDKDAYKHKGISYFLVPMDKEGITVRPLQKINGEAEFNEIFFDNVEVPKDNYVGELNKGWKVAMTTLSYERGILALGRQSRFETEFERAVEFSIDNGFTSDNENAEGKVNSYYKQQIAEAYLDLRVMKYHSLNVISDYLNNDGNLGPEVSLQKLYWSGMRKKLGNLYLELQNDDVFNSEKDSLSGDYFTDVYYTAIGENIYAGTSQIQKNIIAERVLGLPR